MDAFVVAVGILVLIPIATGALLLATGASPFQPCRGSARLDSQTRFLGAAWLGYGGFAALFLSDQQRYAPLFYVSGAAIVLGGLGRLVSWLRIGRPDPVSIGAIVVELAIMPTMILWFWLRTHRP